MKAGEILAIHSSISTVGGYTFVTVGRNGVTEIQLRNIRGELSLVPYIYVYKGAQLWLELPQSRCIIEYKINS